MTLIKRIASFIVFVVLYFGSIKCITPYEEIIQYKEEYALPELPYNYDGLEPFIDEATVRVHHLGHHAAYTKKLNAALKSWRESVSTKGTDYKVAKFWIAFFGTRVVQENVRFRENIDVETWSGGVDDGSLPKKEQMVVSIHSLFIKINCKSRNH